MQLTNIRAMIDNEAPLVLDGGLGSELDARGYDVSSALWSAELVSSHPAAIVEVHRAYLDAGARCIISASYQASRMGFGGHGIASADADQLILDSVSLAKTARDEFLADRPGNYRAPLVAASIGPYGAALADGSEYVGDYKISAVELRNFHESRFRLLDGSGADVLAVETIPNKMEAEVLSELLRGAVSPAWVSFSCKDNLHISDGSLFRDACAVFANHPNVLAVGVNCTPPEFITKLIAEAKAGAPEKTIVVYPNSGETYHAADNSWSGKASDADFGFKVAEWQRAGAALIGGCCRVGPKKIQQIVQAARS